MLFRLFLLFTLVPLVELCLLLVLADWLGWQFTLALVILTGVLGAWLARQQGLRCWRRVHETMAARQIPGDPLMDGLMILVAGALLVTPGVLTDLVGFALLTPPFRRAVKGWLKRRFQARINLISPGNAWPPADQPRPHDEIIETKFVDEPPEDAGDEK